MEYNLLPTSPRPERDFKCILFCCWFGLKLTHFLQGIKQQNSHLLYSSHYLLKAHESFVQSAITNVSLL